MATYNGRQLTPLKGLNIKDVVRFEALATSPTVTTGERILFVNSSGQLIFQDGSSSTTLGSSGSVSSFNMNDAYDDGSSVTVDAGAIVLAGVSEATAVLNITADAGSSGACLLIANSGSGNDVTGTSSLWSVSAAGAAVFTGIVMGDDEAITLGASSDATIQWVGASNHLDIGGATNFDGNMTIEAAHTLTIAGTAGSDKLTVTAGDVVLGEGSITLTDDDNAASLSITNDGATTAGNGADTGVVNVVCDTLTTGTLLHLSVTEGTLNGGHYLKCWDETADATVLSVGEDGLLTIAGNAAGTNAIVVTVGDLYLSDTDGSIIESEDGTATLLTVDNKAGVIASDSAVLLVDAGGAVASGGNALRVIFSGAADAGAILAEFLPDAASVGIKVEAGGVATAEALYIDADPTANSVVYVHSDAVIADNKAVIEVHQATGAMASGSSLLRLECDSTPAASVFIQEIDLTGVTATNDPGAIWVNGVGKDVKGILVDVDNTDVHAVQIDGSGAISGGRMLLVDNDGTPAANTDAVAEFTFTGTATNNPVVVNINNSTKDAAPLLVTSNVAAATRSVGTFIQDSTTGAKAVVTLQQDDVSEEFLAFNSTAGSGASVDLTNTTPAAVLGSVIVSAVDGTKYRVALYAAAGWL